MVMEYFPLAIDLLPDHRKARVHFLFHSLHRQCEAIDAAVEIAVV